MTKPLTYTIKQLDQLRAVSHPMRVAILEQIANQPLTVTAIAQAIKTPVNRAYYHVIELERAKVIRAVRTRKRANLVEKLYQAVAPNIRVDEKLFHRGGAAGLDLFHETIRSVLDASADDLRRMADRGPIGPDTLERTIRAFVQLRLRPRDLEELHGRLRDLIDEFKGRDRADATSRAALTVVFCPYPDATPTTPAPTTKRTGKKKT